MSYLYDGLSFNVLVEGRDATGVYVSDGWHSDTGKVFKPTSEYLRTNGEVITRSDVTTEGHSLLESFYGGYLEKSYYMQDDLGSVIGIANERGKIEEEYAYDSFGRATEGSFDGVNRLGYNGKRIDPFMGRYDYGFRDYSPVLQRFTTVDPVKDGSNWYAYVGNDPVNFIDPLGLDPNYAGLDTNYYYSGSASQSDVNNVVRADLQTRPMDRNWPVEEGRITTVYGPTTPAQTNQGASNPMHGGIDLAPVTPGDTGQAVSSTERGIVTNAGSDTEFGNTVTVQHPDGTSSQYSHLEGINVEEGQRLEKGDTVGTLGNTGKSSGAHVDYREYDQNGDKYNPMYDLPSIPDTIVPDPRYVTENPSNGNLKNK